MSTRSRRPGGTPAR
ncbi:Two-component hybrid sensor histidine kinase/response regulator, partial [Pseudomonas syringae pv. syringae]